MDLKNQLEARLRHIDVVLMQLSESEGFETFVADYQRTIDEADSSWHHLDSADPGFIRRFLEAKYNKLAALSVTGALERYRQEKGMIENQLQELNDPDVQRGYGGY